MHIDPLEKRWLWTVGAIVLIAWAVQIYSAALQNTHPPSNVEVINSAELHLGSEFAEDKLGVHKNDDGSLTVTMVAARFGFYPQELTLPSETPITFRWASFDVLHGVHVPFTNMSTMIVPGYVSEVNTTFKNTGEVPFLCNEYCGLGHDNMYARLNIVPKAEWKM